MNLCPLPRVHLQAREAQKLSRPSGPSFKLSSERSPRQTLDSDLSSSLLLSQQNWCPNKGLGRP